MEQTKLLNRSLIFVWDYNLPNLQNVCQKSSLSSQHMVEERLLGEVCGVLEDSVWCLAQALKRLDVDHVYPFFPSSAEQDLWNMRGQGGFTYCKVGRRRRGSSRWANTTVVRYTHAVPLELSL